MQAITLTPEYRAAAPGLAEGIRVVLTGLATLIARGLLKNPRYVALILPLWNRLNRAASRFDRLMARVAAGTEQPRPRSATPRTGSHGANPYRFPAPRAWLLAALRHEAAHYTQRIEHLLSDPAAAQLVAATPQAQSLLRPICHMLGVRHASLGVRHPAIPPRQRKRPPSPLPHLQTKLGEGGPAAEPSPQPPPEPCHHGMRWPPLPSPKPPSPPDPVSTGYISIAEYWELAHPSLPPPPAPS